MAIKTSDQITIVDITDAYSVMLTNEAHTFSGDTKGAIGGSTTTQVVAFCGAEQVAVTVGTITCPTGMTATPKADTGGLTYTITFNVTNELTTGGTVTIPVTITGTEVKINKTFTYSVALVGNGISKIETFYLTTASGSGVNTSTSGWDQTPDATDTTKKYLWSYQKTTYTNGTTSNTSPSIISTHGATGATGATGNGISKVETLYLTTTLNAGVDTSTTGWSTTPTATDTTNRYIWSYQKVTYTDGTTTSTNPAIVGTHGTSGADAITISITTSDGSVFKNSSGKTTLTAHVYSAGKELSSSEIAALGDLKWYKDGSTTATATGATLEVDAADITGKATYSVQLEG